MECAIAHTQKFVLLALEEALLVRNPVLDAKCLFDGGLLLNLLTAKNVFQLLLC